MSTEYYTEPKIEYEKIINSTSVEVKDPPRKIYIVESKTLYKNGSHIHVRNDNGFARFERFGDGNIHNVFPSLIEEFKVKFFDEYGMEYPDCTS